MKGKHKNFKRNPGEKAIPVSSTLLSEGRRKSGTFLEYFLEMLRQHPFICAAMITFALTPFGFGAESYISGEAIFTVSLFGIAAEFILIYWLQQTGHMNKRFAVVSMIGLVILTSYVVKFFHTQEKKSDWILFTSLFFLGCLFYCASRISESQDMKRRLYVLSIMGGSFIIKFYYVLCTQYYTRQHDVGVFGEGDGHASVIEYYLNNKHLPDFDVRLGQFYQPPLYHIISASWIDFLENFCGVNPELARESVQMLTLFYSTACVIIVYKIFRYFGFKEKSLYIPLTFFAFHPQFIILSGSINNDILSTTFMLAAILCTLMWYKNPTVWGIVKLALAIGLGMMTKLSAALVAPAIALIFLIMLLKGSRQMQKLKKLIKQYVIFGIICCPLGLWWGIRNYMLYKVPFTYIPRVSEDVAQYVGYIPFLSRITDFSLKQFENLFDCLGYADMSYMEYNPLIAAMKTAVFGEWVYDFRVTNALRTIPTLLFWSFVLLAATTFISMLIYTFHKTNKICFESKILLFVFYMVVMLNFYNFCRAFPHICSQDFRYITSILLVNTVYLALPIAEYQEHRNNGLLKWTSTGLIILSAIVSITSILTYGVIFQL